MTARIVNIVSGAPSGALNIALNIADYLGKFYTSDLLLRKYNRANVKNAVVIPDRLTVDYIYGLCRYLKQHRVDLIIVHGYSTHLWTKIAAAIQKIPLIHVEHNVEKYTPLRRKLLQMLDRYTAGYICVSQGVAKHLIAQGADRRKVKVIYNGIAAEQFHITKIPHQVFTIGMTARFSKQKDQLTLIRAVEYLYREHKLPIRLTLQGSGKNKQKCLDYVKKQKLQTIVSFETGSIVDLLPRLDLFVLATHYEGFGLVICEAMASGLPVIATNVSGVDEIVINGENGWLVPPCDFQALAIQIEDCYSRINTKDVKNIIKNGYKNITTRFSIDKMHKEYKEIINGLKIAKD
jgi:glycosyltransferase involved in cell wall biosynthesis